MWWKKRKENKTGNTTPTNPTLHRRPKQTLQDIFHIWSCGGLTCSIKKAVMVLRKTQKPGMKSLKCSFLNPKETQNKMSSSLPCAGLQITK